MRQRPSATAYSETRNGKRPPGRPRSEEARIAILRSTLEVLGKHGFSDLTIEGIADRAAVGKGYRLSLVAEQGSVDSRRVCQQYNPQPSIFPTQARFSKI